MQVKRGWIYDGPNRLELVESYGKLTLRSELGVVNSRSAEKEFAKMITDKIKIAEDIYIGNYREYGFLIIKGNIKKLDSSIWKYIEDDKEGLPELP